jgi:GGDEF domain-containing protein
MLMIRLNNSDHIAEKHGKDSAQELFQKVSDYLAKLRRGSDFLGQTALDEHCLLMQRPAAVTEPVEAAERFILAMREFENRPEIAKYNPQFQIRLIELPSGEILIDQFVPNKSEDTASVPA